MNSIRNNVFFIVLTFTLITANCYSQDYRLINPKRVLTFTKTDSADYENYFLFVKVDSAKVEGTDSIYYFNRLLDTVSEPFCMTDTLALGEKMVIQNDTDVTHVFFNKIGDSIFIRTHVDVGDTWRMYTFPDNRYISASVISKLYLTILPDVSDTVLRIKMNVFSETGSLLSEVFPSGTKLDITEKYGIIEFWPFYNFPYDTVGLILRGISNPDENYVDVNARAAFDFLLGNEFHYEETVVSDGGVTHTLQKEFILGIEDFSDHITYQVLRVLWQRTQAGSVADTIRIIDTIEVNYNYADYAFLDTIELKIFEHTKAGFSDWIQNDSLYKGLAYKNVYEWYEADADKFCLLNLDNTSLPEQSYGDGFGLIHYFDSTSAENYDHLDLVYFQKGLLEWGTPIVFDSLGFDPVETLVSNNNIQLFPNPVSDFLFWQIGVPLTGNVSVYIYDIYGNLINKTECAPSDNNFMLNCSDLPDGNYLIKISAQDLFYAGKFIKI